MPARSCRSIPGATRCVGRRAYPTIAAAPAPPDVAILAVPGSSLVATVREAAAAGVGCCVIISTGFAEAGDDGAARQAELVAIARESGMRLVGPNCMGLIVPHHRLALCSSVVLDTDRLPDGAIGLVSQSGALMVSIFDRAAADGIGFRYGVSLGNQVDLEICDFLDYMIAEPHTAALCVYVEGLLDGARFRRSLAAARAAGKPVLVVKTGRTQAGVKSARSHTASLAGAWEVFEAVCREEGAVLARDPDDMVRAAHFLVRHRAPRRGGVGILSSSGGGCGIASDRVSELGVPLATLTAGLARPAERAAAAAAGRQSRRSRRAAQAGGRRDRGRRRADPPRAIPAPRTGSSSSPRCRSSPIARESSARPRWPPTSR